MEKIVSGTVKTNGVTKNWDALNYEFLSGSNITIFYYNGVAQMIMFYGDIKEYYISNSGEHVLLHRYIERIFNDITFKRNKKNVLFVDGTTCITINKTCSNYLLSFASSEKDVNYFNIKALKNNEFAMVDNFLGFLLKAECQVDFKNTIRR